MAEKFEKLITDLSEALKKGLTADAEKLTIDRSWSALPGF